MNFELIFSILIFSPNPIILSGSSFLISKKFLHNNFNNQQISFPFKLKNFWIVSKNPKHPPLRNFKELLENFFIRNDRFSIEKSHSLRKTLMNVRRKNEFIGKFSTIHSTKLFNSSSFIATDNNSLGDYHQNYLFKIHSIH